MDIKKQLNEYLDSYLVISEKNSILKSIFKKNNENIYSSEMEEACIEKSFSPSIDDYIDTHKEDETFQTKLFKFIDDRMLKDSDVYRKVDIDRRLFSKIRSNINYHPSKETIILLGLALELSENEIEDLLTSASYSLPMNTKYDLIIRFCFKEKIYDLKQINELLYDHNCKLLNQ